MRPVSAPVNTELVLRLVILILAFVVLALTAAAFLI
jgi:hypothetical protein